MLSPSDLELRARVGDETVATTADDDQPDAPKLAAMPFNNLAPPHTYDPQPVGTLSASGGTQSIRIAYQPDFWIVSLGGNYTAGLIQVSYGASAKSVPDAEIGARGYCRIPGRGTDLTLRNIGTDPAKPTVVACGGWGELNSGDILIVPGG